MMTSVTTTEPPAAPRPTRLTVRARVTLTAALLSALALGGAGVLVYTLESARIERGVTAQIDQEVAELRTFQQSAVDPENGRPIDDADRLLEVFLQRNVPDDDELLVRYEGTEPRFRTRNEYGSEVLVDPAYVAAVEPLLDEGGTSVLEGTAFGEVWVTAVPVRNNVSRGSLVIVNFLEDEHEELDRTLRTYAVVSLLSLGLLTLLAAWQSGRLLAPLRVLRETADDIEATDLSRRIPERGNDDITALTRTINGMLERLEGGFASQRQFLDDAGHELRTPLTVLRGHLELLDAGSPDDVAETRDLLLDEVDRMSRLVGDLILLAKSERPDFLTPAPVDVGLLTDAVLAKASALGERAWRLDARAEGTAVVDEQRLTQALLQLADNAVKHTAPGGVVAVGSAVRGGDLLLWVRDEGRGVPVADRERIFERFGRSVVPRGDEGFGLGLSIVRAIAEAHGGAAYVEDPADDGDPAARAGSRFVVRLPLVRPAAPPPSAAAGGRRPVPLADRTPTVTVQLEEAAWPAS